MSIRKRFIISSILWGIVPVLISTSICFANFNFKIMEMIKENVAILSNDQSIHLRSFFDNNITNLNANSNIPVIKDVLLDSNSKEYEENYNHHIEVLNGVLSNAKNGQFFINEELLVNNSGIIISSSNDEDINKNIILTNEEMERISNGEVVITNIIEKDDFNKGIKSAIIAKPIFWDRKYQGFIANVINMNYFEKLVNDVHFFETGKIVIMDKSGRVAASSSKDFSQSINEIKSDNNLYEQWNKIDFYNNPSGIIEYKMNGIDKIGHYSIIGNSGWIVLSGVEWEEFKGPIDKTIKDISIVLIIFLFFIIITYMYILDHFSKPIYKLLEVIRNIKQGDYKERFIYNKENEFRDISIAFNELIDTVEKNKKEIEDKNNNLQALTSNIPGGVYCLKIENGEYILDFVSSGYLDILGYDTHDGMEIFEKRLFQFIYESDLKRVANEMQEQISKYNGYRVEYRVKKKDGSIVWLLDNAQIVQDRDGKLSSYNVVINITESKTIQNELKLSEERYRIILSQTENVIFEWNINKDTIYFSQNLTSKFKFKPIINDISENIYRSDRIHKDDIDKLGEVLNEIICGSTYKEIEVRIKIDKDEYIWCNVRMTAMFNEEGNIFKVIGVIIDIDNEKKEAEKLLFKAQRDSLTNLYNKGTTKQLIESYISNEGKNNKHTFFIIDIDDFKSINDNLGHLVGDYVLSDISLKISSIFRENDIIGRIGGDEFVVFLKNVDSEDVIHQKGEKIVKAFRECYVGEDNSYKVSGSIGVARYPDDGASFEDLYINADRALYEAKKAGKDRYFIFNDITSNNI